jgi:hypothetical protein
MILEIYWKRTNGLFLNILEKSRKVTCVNGLFERNRKRNLNYFFMFVFWLFDGWDSVILINGLLDEVNVIVTISDSQA